MGDMNPIFVEHFTFNDDYIDIDLAFAPALALGTSKVGFDRLATIMNLPCRQITRPDDGRIHKPRLIEKSHGLGAPQPRALWTLEKRALKLEHGTLNHRDGVADV